MPLDGAIEPQKDAAVSEARPRRKEAESSFTLNAKLWALALVVELGVIATSLVAAWLFALEFGGDDKTRLTMMLGPAVTAVVELARVPLALMAGAHASRIKRWVAIVAVVCLTALTARSLAIIALAQYTPFLTETREKQATLLAARQDKAGIDARLARAKADVDAAKQVLDQATERAKAVGANLTQLPGAECHTETARRNGRKVGRQACSDDARVRPLIGTLAAADQAVKAAVADYDLARRRFEAIDPAQVDRAVAAAEQAYRDAATRSQMHEFAALALGKDAADITSGELNGFMQIFVYGASILTALVSSAVALCAVTRVQPAKTLELPDEGLPLLMAKARQVADAWDARNDHRNQHEEQRDERRLERTAQREIEG